MSSQTRFYICEPPERPPPRYSFSEQNICQFIANQLMLLYQNLLVLYMYLDHVFGCECMIYKGITEIEVCII